MLNVFKQIIEELTNTQEQSIQESKLNEYGEEVNKLWEKLMYLEVAVVDQIEVGLSVLNLLYFLL